MVATKTKTTEERVTQLIELTEGQATFHLLGTGPILFNRIKDWGPILLPPKKKKGQEREMTLRKDPYDDFLQSPYRDQDDDAPTLIQGLAVWFKLGCARAAIDSDSGLQGTFVRRHLRATGGRDGGERIAIYGVPEMHMAVARLAGATRAPDIRTRVVMREWCCQVTFTWAQPQLNLKQVSTLLGNSGMISGAGDWRLEKGGDYGAFRIVDPKKSEYYKRIKKTGGRKKQIAAMNNPAYYNLETAETFEQFLKDAHARGFHPRQPAVH